MNSKKIIPLLFSLIILVSGLIIPDMAEGYEVFVYRPRPEKKPLSDEKRIVVHGEFFAQFQFPSTFPSYNDLSGDYDRWNLGFRNLIFLTEQTSLHAQLITHDDGNQRTKFDWHFSLRQSLLDNLVVIIGHDSNHDSDRGSYFNSKRFYTNRNYIGIGFPIEGNGFYIEPFAWIFHTTNQRSHLDLSGEKIKQEYGLRVGALLTDRVLLSLQILAQTDTLFYLGQAFQADCIVRIGLVKWFEVAIGGSIWKDIMDSPAGNRNSFYKLIWGVAVPF